MEKMGLFKAYDYAAIRKRADTKMKNTFYFPTIELRQYSGAYLFKDQDDPTSYYGIFQKFLSGDEEARGKFKKFLLKPEIIESTCYRSSYVKFAERFGISIEEAMDTQRLAPFELDPEDAADIVLDNYLSMVESPNPHHVYAYLDKNGRVCIVEGLHRATVNYVAGFEATPVKVLRRDQEWLDFIAFFREEGQSLYGDSNAIYHRIDHPDFSDFSVIREDRSRPIVQYLKGTEARSGLDVGSMVGFYSHTLGLAGYTMSAIEYEPKYADAFERLARLYGSGAHVNRGDIYGIPIQKGQYDFAVMLSIIYHLLRNDEQRALAYLEDIKSKIPLFFIDTENRTGLLPETKLREIFAGYEFTLLFSGADDRQIYAIKQPN